MPWDGWQTLDGVELLNGPRVERYLSEVGWFTPRFRNDSLPLLLGQPGGYRTPVVDEPDWIDPRRPESYDFVGIYPLSINGLENSSAVVQMTELVGDGGYPSSRRWASGTVVYSVLLIGRTDAAADYGMSWLKSVLLADACTPGQWGAQLCYLAAAPEVDTDFAGSTYTVVLGEIDGGFSGDAPGGTMDGGTSGDSYDTDHDGGTSSTLAVETFPMPGYVSDIDQCFSRLYRQVRRVTTLAAPQITSKQETSDGWSLWTVSFTLGVGNPFEYGDEIPVLSGFLEHASPWVGGGVGILDADGHGYVDVDCSVVSALPASDPLFPSAMAPPEPPSVPLANWKAPASWTRYTVSIPSNIVPIWLDMVPGVKVRSLGDELRSVRLRFYADPDEDGTSAEDPCGFCGDVVISYIPPGGTITIDGVDQVVWLDTPSGERQRAEALIFDTRGEPFDWPILTCGTGYVLAVDTLRNGPRPSVDLSLYPKGN